VGNFYVNYTIKGAPREKLAEAFVGRNAIFTPEKNGCIVAADEISNDQHQEVISELAKIISQLFRWPVLAILNHDDDILWYQLWNRDELIDEYDSCPNYFSGSDEGEGPKGGNPKRLCAAFGANNPTAVERILRSNDYVFAIERHQALVEALGISDFSVGFGYRYANGGELPPGLEEEQLLRITA
jgi:hypothetical protein